MSLSVFAVATLLLLLTPGPTNTLIALTGAQYGLRRCLPLVAAELMAYLAFVGVFVFMLGALLARLPGLLTVCQAAAAAWVLYLVVKLWRAPASTSGHSAPIGWRAIFLTTVLNPKGLIVASMLLQLGETGHTQGWGFLIFALSIASAALVWSTLACTVLPTLRRHAPRLITRVAALVLLGFFCHLMAQLLA